ncbi:MAG: acyloxyacyl hydrolase [Cytophagales bacterium]|nr:acyloxyacyl hydrolase [Cytophagales bacterium]
MSALRNSLLFLTCFFLLGWSTVWAQKNAAGSKKFSSWYVEPEVMAGFNVKNWSRFPDYTVRTGYQVSIGKVHQDTSVHWHGYYRFPNLGISLMYSDPGSPVLGDEISVVPYFMVNLSREKARSFYLKVGMGGSYVTNSFDSLQNPGNEIVGAPWNWQFQLFMYRTLWLSNKWHVRIGGGYVHTSNSHTELPNFGLNSGMFTLAFQRNQHELVDARKSGWAFRPDRRQQYFWQVIPGLGFHELGGTRRPIDTPNKLIASLAIETGIIFKQHFKVKTGFTYRYYDSFRDDIINRELAQYEDQPIWNASHLYWTLGMEYLLGHFSFEIQSGITIHKPYFDLWYFETAGTNKVDKFRNKFFPNRIGGNVYLLNTNKNPPQNVFFGVHVNANWGTADFHGFTLGYVRRWSSTASD